MAMPGMDAMMSPGAMPGGGNMPGLMPGGNNMMDMGLASLDGLTNKDANPTAAMRKVEEALKLAHKLIMTSLPQINQWSPRFAKDLHTIGRQILQTQLDMMKEMPPPGMPPPGLMSGEGAMGLPSGTPFGSMP